MGKVDRMTDGAEKEKPQEHGVNILLIGEESAGIQALKALAKTNGKINPKKVFNSQNPRRDLC